MKKALLFLRNLFDLYIPAAAFLMLFVAFVLQVFFRYALNSPLTWTNDIIVVGFVWTVLFGASYTMRARKHVKFTMLYDALKPRPAAAARLAGNVIIVLTFVPLVIPSVNYAMFVNFQKTPVFRIPYAWIFMPFVYFVVAIVGYTLPEIIEDIRVLSGKLKDSADHLSGGLS